MAFTAPEDEVDATAQAPVSTQPFTAPPDDQAAAVKTFAADKDFDYLSHAAQNPSDVDFAYQVKQARDAMPLSGKILDAVSSPWQTTKNAAVGVGHFLSSLAKGPMYAAQHAYYSATGDPRALTKRAEETLAAQGIEQSTDGIMRKLQSLGIGGSAELPDEYQDPEETSRLALAKQESAKKDAFLADVQQLKNEFQLQSGKPLDEGVIADIYKAGNTLPSTEVSPEVLAAQNAPPADPDVVASMQTASDPTNLAYSIAPELPGARYVGGRVVQGIGKVAQLPMRAIEALPGRAGRAASALASGAGLGVAEGIIHDPITTAKVVGGVLAAKGLQKIGQAMEQQGAEAATGAPSQLSQDVAAGRLKSVREGMPTNYRAELGRVVGDLPVNAASTAVGMAPLNLLTSDGDPQKFVDSEAGAAAFGGVLGSLHSSRPQLVESLRPYLRTEGARTMDVETPLGKASSDYINSLPDDSKNSILEAMGALQGLRTEGAKGDQGHSRFYVVDDATYQKEIAKLTGSTAADGGRGFFIDGDGRAIINGDAQGGAGDLAHTLGHEGGHMAAAIMRAGTAPGSAAWDGMVGKVSAELMPKGKPTDEFQSFIDTYNKKFDPTGKTQALDASDPKAVEEFLAEHSGRIFAGDPDVALPKNIFDNIHGAVGQFSAKAMGLDKIGQTSSLNAAESTQATALMRDILMQIAQRPREAAPVLKPAAPDPVAPTAAPAAEAPAAEDVNRSARLQSLGIDQAQVDAAKDKAVADAVAAEKARRGKRPMSEKAAAEVADAAGQEFDGHFETYAKALEYAGAPHPDGQDLDEAIKLNELGSPPVSVRSKTPSASSTQMEDFGSPDRVIDEPVEGEAYPYSVTPEERDALQKAGWNPDEIAAMPQSQVQREVSKAPKASTIPATGKPGDLRDFTAQTQSAPSAAPAAVEQLENFGKDESTTETPVSGKAVPQGNDLADFPASGASKVPQVDQREINAAIAKGNVAAAEKAARARGSKTKSKEDRQKEIEREERVKALSELIKPGDPGLHVETDADTGEQTIRGDIDPKNAVHAEIIKALGYGPDQIKVITDAQKNKGKGVFVRDYNSAAQEGFETGDNLEHTGEKREKEYAASPTSKVQGKRKGEVSKQDKGFTPFGTVLTDSGLNIRGFDHDKFLSNLRSVIDAADAAKIRTGLEDVKGKERDAAISEAFRKVVENHRNGWKGDGSDMLKSFPDSGITANQDYAGQPVDKDLANVINMALHNRSAKTPGEPKRKTELAAKQNAARDARSKEAIGFARINDGFLNEETGETNPLRDKLEKGGFAVDKTLKPTISNLRPDLIGGGIHDTPTHGKNVHAHGFDIAPKELTASGLPNRVATAAGFMPGDKGDLANFMPSGGAEEELRHIAERAFPSHDIPPLDIAGILERNLSYGIDTGIPKEEAEQAAKRARELTDGLRAKPEPEIVKRDNDTKTTAFKKWFSGSKITNRGGSPKPLFHGTTGDFNTFDAGEFGFHLGDESSADLFGPTKKVFLNSKKPFVLNKDLGNWKPEDLLKELQKKTSVSPEERTAALRETAALRDKYAEDISQDDDMLAHSRALYKIAEPVRRLFESKGFDSIDYKNEGEGGRSYIAFRPEQIKSATDNSGAFDSSNPDIRFMPGGKGDLADFGNGKTKVEDESGAPLTVYHGTSKSFDEFSPSKGMIFFSENPDYTDHFKGSNGRVINANLDIKNPLDLTDIGARESITREDLSALLKEKGVDVSPKDLHPNEKDDDGNITGSEILQHVSQGQGAGRIASAAKQAGFDGIVQNEYVEGGPESRAWIAFSPDQIKEVKSESLADFMPSDREENASARKSQMRTPGEIAMETGLKYDGEIKSTRGLAFHQFTDPKTGNSFQVSGPLTTERVEARRTEKIRTGFMPSEDDIKKITDTAKRFKSAKEFGSSLKDSDANPPMNNKVDEPYAGEFKSGELSIEKYGDNPYVYQNRYIDPKSLGEDYNLEGDTYQQVVDKPSTQKYIEWYKEGYEPPPITLVRKTNDRNNLHSSNRRRVIAALEAGVDRIPARVEIGRRDDIWKRSNGEPYEARDAQFMPSDLEFVQPDAAKRAREKVVEINIPKFDKLYSKDSVYLGPNDPGIAGRRRGVEKFIDKGLEDADGNFTREPMLMPRVSIMDGIPGFTDGRHRFATLRERGFESMPVSMDADSAKHAKELGITQYSGEKDASAIKSQMPKRTWFVRDGKRIYHHRHDDGTFGSANPSLANFSSQAMSPASDDKKQLADFK